MLSTAALLLADARTPTGSYAHSGGLEAAVAAGLGVDGVPAFLRGRLETVGHAEAALAAAAARAAHAQGLDDLLALDVEALARCPSPVLREAAASLGRGLLRTAADVWPAAACLSAYRARSTRTPRPVALGVAAAAGGLTPLEAALVSLHEDAATVAAAAVKLLAVDAAATTAWVAQAGPLIERLARDAARPRPFADLPSGAAPLIDRRSIEHRHDERRLFAS